MLAKIGAVLGIVGLSLTMSYKLGYERAQHAYELQATQSHQKLMEALRQASDALSRHAQMVREQEAADDQRMKEIEDAANADGAVCHVPADRLLPLDAIR